MSKITQVNNAQQEYLPITQLKKMDYNSIWNRFNTNGDDIISDEEIHKQGYTGKVFKIVKEYILQTIGSYNCENVQDEQGFFPFEPTDRANIKVIKSLNELEKRNGCCYDVRNCNISKLNLTKEELLNLTIDKTTVMSAEQKEILSPYIEKMKDPGLNIKNLHKQGITGKGVKMAIIDQPLGKHEEYASNLTEPVHDINSEEMRWNSASMHGSAVTSIAVGKNTGVAPDANLVYYSAINLTNNKEDIAEYRKKLSELINKNDNNVQYYKEQLKELDKEQIILSNKPYVQAINKILDENEKLPQKDRVSVISISWGFDELGPGFEEYQKAIKRAKEQGVFIITTGLSRDYNMETCGANRNPQGDINSSLNYEAGAFFKEYSENNISKEYADKHLLVPMDHRTVADYTDNESYRYEGNDGGMSWSTPWLAGMYVLAKQVRPDITPEEFWNTALKTSDECKNNDTGTYVGRIINPEKLIEEIKTDK